MRRRVRKDPIISKLSTIPVTCPQRPAGMSDVPICAACAPPASRVSPWGRLTANLCRGQGLARCSRKLDRCQLRPSHDPPSSPHQTAERVLAAHARPSFASAPEGGGWSAKRRTRGRTACVSRRMRGACEAPVEPFAKGRRPPLGAPTVAFVVTREARDCSAPAHDRTGRGCAPSSARLIRYESIT
jgi:hypothetical protein